MIVVRNLSNQSVSDQTATTLAELLDAMPFQGDIYALSGTPDDLVALLSQIREVGRV